MEMIIVKLTEKDRPKVEKCLIRAKKNLADIERLIGKLAVEREDSIQLVKELEELLQKDVVINPIALPTN